MIFRDVDFENILSVLIFIICIWETMFSFKKISFKSDV